MRALGCALACAALLLLLPFPAGANAPADEVRRLVEAGRSAEAYAAGRRHAEALGQPEFDFWFGIAAIDSGHAGDGVLALERYVLRFPENDRARLELARGYFALGEFLRAREEFEAVARRNPPPAVQATIERFLDAIRAQESRYLPSASAYAEIGIGYDSNVNSGVGSASIDVPALGPVLLGPAGLRTGDRFLHLGAGGQLTRPISPGVALFGGGSFEGKLHSDAFDRQFDLGSLGVFGGLSALRGRDLYRATLAFGTVSVDHARFRDTTALGAEWHRQVDELNTASAFVQLARLEYPRQSVRDADLQALGAGWRRAFVHPLRPVAQLQALVAREQNDASPVRDDLSRHLYTVRAGLALTPAPRWAVSAGLSYTASRFRAEDPLFLRRREDDFFALDLGASYRWSSALTLRAEYQRYDNRSNIALYRYDRDVLAVKLRYEFR